MLQINIKLTQDMKSGGVMDKEIYRKLQERLDQYSLGFPATESGVELNILERLFSEEDAEMFLHLSPQLDTPENIARRLGLEPEGVGARLDDMAERGLLFRLKKGDSVKYAAAAFVAGIFEFQLPTLDRELAELVEQYGNEAFDKAIADGAVAFLRPVPVNRSLDVKHHVAAYEDACEIIKSAKKIALAECICRKQQGLIEKGCGKPGEACFLFGSNGQYYIDRGMAREVDVDEALMALKRAQEAGLVTQPGTSQNPGGMCNCCGDCCGVLRALNKHPRPAEKVLSNYFAAVDQESCTGCETCLDRCQMGAISLNSEELASANLERCIGCGLCVTTCPEEAIRLESKPENMRLVPPETGQKQMAFMAQKRAEG